MKKLLLLCLTALLSTATWAYDFQVENKDGIAICYNVISSSDNTCEVTYTGSSRTTATTYTGDIVIPSSVDYDGSTYLVIGIGEYAFYNAKTNITSISLPETITYIGQYAFYYCSGLTELDIPNGVTEIGLYSFYYCSGLTTMTLPSSLVSVGNYAFYNCTSLVEITIQEGLSSLSDSMFYGCSNLATVNLPDGLTTIGSFVFYNCKALVDITIPENVTEIGSNCFCNCTSLLEITIPNNVSAINDNTFDGCSALAKATLGSGITSIGGYAFRNSGLVEINLPNGLSSLGMSVFYGCASLMAITVPRGVTEFKGNTFRGCTSLTDVTLHDDLTTFSTYEFYGCSSLKEITLPKNATSLGDYMFYGCTLLEDVELPEALTKIGADVFYNCTSLATINLPETLSSLGNYTFYGCTALETITLPEALSSMGTYLFYNCSSLKEISIPGKVSSIGNYTFSGCAGLEKVVLGNRVSSVGSYTFQNCTKLTSLSSLNPTPPSVSNANAFSTMSLDECTLYVPTQSIEAYQSDSQWSVFTNVKGVGYTLTVNTLSASDVLGTSATLNATIIAYDETVIEQGFEYYTSADDIKKVVANKGEEMSVTVTNLSPGTSHTYYAYAITESGTTYGKEVTFTTSPNDFIVDDIYYYILSTEEKTCVVTRTQSSQTTTTKYTGDIVIPETVDYNGDKYTVVGIEGYSFYSGSNNYNITSVSLPNTLTFIGTYAFYGCRGLTSLDIPDAVTSLGARCFYNCVGLTSIHLPSNITEIDEYLFYACSGLAELEIPEAVTSINTYAFYNCSGLKSIKFPETLVSIGNYAFYSCSSLTELNLPASVTSIGGSAFHTCKSLTEITIPEKITVIADWTFSNCTSLAKVTLPVGVTTIEQYAFSSDSSLEEISLPTNVSSIGNYVFQNCSNLVRVYSYNPEPPTCGTSVFYGINSECVLSVPSYSIEDYASADTWKDFYSIIGLNVPLVSTLDATNITKETATLNGTIFLIEGSEDILELGFEYWAEDESATTIIVEEVQDEEMSADVSGLTEETTYTYHAYVTIENGTYYGPNVVFSTANRTADFYVDGIYYNYGEEEATCEVTYGDEEYNSYFGVVNVPERVLYNKVEYTVVGVGESAFRESTGLIEAHLPNTLTYISIWSFYNCSALTEMLIPNDVIEIGNQAFNGCGGLTSVTIGSSVEFIGSNSFNCSNLQDIYTLNPEPPVCDDYAFRSVNKESCALYVPDRAYETYYDANVWKDFYNMIEMKIFRVETLEATDITETSAVLNGTAIEAWDEPGSISTKGFVYWDVDPNVITTVIISDESEDLSYTLESLTPETTYTYRAFAVTESGTTYGDNVKFTTGEEFISPTVQTYEASDITSTSALIKGYVEAGTEEITEQGFEYWTGEEEPESIVSDDNVMALILVGLNPETNYTYRAYAITESGITYGEDVEFTTLEDTTTGINGIRLSLDSENVEGIYSTSGQKLNSTVKGVNIIRYNDGTVKKIYVK